MTRAVIATFALAALARSASARPIRVAVERGPSAQSSAAALAAQLEDDTYFDFSATVVSADAIDTAAELADFDVVVLGDSGLSDNDVSLPLATALEAWVEDGRHGIVTVGWTDYMTQQQPARDAALDAITPIDAYPYWYEYCSTTPTISPIPPTHVLMAGIPAFQLSTSRYIEYSRQPPDAVDARLAAMVDASECGSGPIRPVVVTGRAGAGRLVYLGLLYLGAESYTANGDLRVGPPDRLLEQALAWAAYRTDSDDDGVDATDNCPNVGNPDQADSDADGAGDACDLCLVDPYDDADGDGVCGNEDNCPDVANADQADADGDFVGDACDTPADADGDPSGCGCRSSGGSAGCLVGGLGAWLVLRRRRPHRR